ncbi:MAG: sodium:proton antiporter [Lachnospiraceae bacterium]|nr:sodium:proton antiporter [Lachnospiraceae bacterium]
MAFPTNFPMISIISCLMCGVVCSILKKDKARYVTYGLMILLLILSGGVLSYTISVDSEFIYQMGHFGAPFGNELRAGVLEGVLAIFFTVIMFLSIIAGEKHIYEDVEENKINLYYTLICLMMSSLLALTYTNDIFTAYVFVEINTITAAGLVAVMGSGRAYFSSAKYMIMSLLGSGLLLIGITLLYDVTGHLLLSNIKEAVDTIAIKDYSEPFTIIIALITIGLSIKSALFPFHSWLPDAHTASTISSSAILSSLVLKAYIVLLIKIYYRAIGWENILETGVNDIVFVFGIMAMIFGSIFAIAQKDVKRMTAYSSVAQIGYIFMGIGIGNTAGIVAAVFHIFAHGATKSMIFTSLGGIKAVSGHSTKLADITGAGFRNKVAGVSFAVGAFSMVGIPFFPGFVSKLNFASAACEAGSVKMIVILVALAISTILNCLYFFRALIALYTPVRDMAGELREEVDNTRPTVKYIATMACFIAVNLFAGTFSDLIIKLITQGLKMFS